MKLVKKVIEIGNGAAVYVPKEYSGREVIVILPEGIEEIKKRILYKLIEFMPNIVGVYIYGSYARGEQELGSDIDVLVITKEKDENIKLALKEIDLRVITLDSLKKAVKNQPLLIMSILKEAKPLLNPILLEELSLKKIDFKKFAWHFEDVKRIISIIEKFIEIDEKNISPSHIYSLIMRLRVCYMAESLLKNKPFTNKEFAKLLSQYKLSKNQIEKFINIYRLVRDNKEPKEKISKEEISKLIGILKDYSDKLENETKKKIRKRN